MSYEADASLAAELQRTETLLAIRAATVTAVSGHTATIQMGGGDPIAGVLAYKDVTLTVGAIVEVLFVGKSIRIVGVTA